MVRRVGHFFLAILLLLIVSLQGLFAAPNALADNATCPFTVDPSSARPNHQVDFTFSVTDTDPSTPIKWIVITSPSGNETMLSASATGWQSSVDPSSGANINGNSLNPGDVVDIDMQVDVGPVAEGVASWNLYAYDGNGQPSNPNDPGNLVCQNSADLNVQDPAPTITNVSTSNIGSRSVDISWTTDIAATTKVNYGLDGQYGKSITSNDPLSTSHSVSLSGLLPGTGYHYQIDTANAANIETLSSDNTFTTPREALSGSVSGSSAPIGLKITNPADKTPPTIIISTVLPKIVQSIPSIQGVATDDLAVTRVEYSTNGGRDWLPANSQADIGSKILTFTFTPAGLDDGDYKILARAIDGGGNITATAPIKVVFDRLPPLVGSSMVSLGPQVLTGTNGEILTQTDVDEKLTLSAVGGPTSINLTTQDQDKTAQPQTFGMSQSQDNGLWSGTISFKKAGTYTLTANSIDGAGNKTTKQISEVAALPAGQITDSKTKKTVSGQVIVYTLQSDTGSWVAWDGSPYGQDNPQSVGKDGHFSYLLPAGKYYLSIQAVGYHNFTSSIFELSRPSPVSTVIELRPGHNIKVLSWLSWSTTTIKLGALADAQKDNPNKLLNKSVPTFSLDSSDGGVVKDATLLGKPTDLVFLNTWSPSTSDQLPALNAVAKNSYVNIRPIAVQENAAKLGAYNKISGYNLLWLADPDSTTTETFETPFLPTHYFIDRNGKVKHVTSGILTKQQILNQLSEL